MSKRLRSISYSCSLLVPILLLTLFAGPLTAAGVDRLAEKLQQRYLSAHSIQFIFEQRAVQNGRTRTGKGTGIFLRHMGSNGIATRSAATMTMRWDYLEPVKQIILSSDNTLSIYSEEDKQLTITTADQLESDILHTLFSGKESLADVFLLSPDPSGNNSMLLVPMKPHPQIQRLHLQLTDQMLIEKLTMEDHFGAQTTLVFSDIRLDTIDPSDRTQVEAILKLDLPAGTEVIHQ